MLNFVWRQLRDRAGRSVALLVGVLVATTGFVVLTGATTTSRLNVTGTVERSTRAAYDILVRPKGTRTPLEAERGLVRPNYLSGLYGGITTAQYDQVKAVAGVDVAAPIAMLGYSTTAVPTPIDLTDAVDRSLARQVIRVDPTFVAERGLSAAPGKPRYVYVTKNPLIYPRLTVEFDSRSAPYSDGRSYPYDEACGPVPREVLPDGRSLPVCDPRWALIGEPGTYSERADWWVDVVRLLPDGRFEASRGVLTTDGDGTTTTSDRLVMAYDLTVPFLLAAVDPAAEQRLVGLSDAVTAGRAIRTDDTITETRAGAGVNRELPVLLTARPFIDEALTARLTRLPGVSPAGVPALDLEKTLAGSAGIPTGDGRSTVADGHRATLAAGLSRTGCCVGQLQNLLQSGEVRYERSPDGTLRAAAQPPVAPDLYGARFTGNPLARPWLADDRGSRAGRPLALPKDPNAFRLWRAVGAFDPEKLTGFSDLGKVPLETYEPPVAEGADARSRTTLGGQPLEPSGNPAGYLSAPPLLLTNLASVPELLKGGTSPQLQAPISAIRVRVADVHGYSERSAERVRLIAERIAQATGLDVDITLGSSPAPQAVELPAGAFGRPELRLTENWSALGVASVIVKAVDRKSAALFLLVLVVCVLFLGNAVSAAVRDRRPELAVLACLGWPARRIGALILGEVTALGLAAGLLAVGLAFPLGAALDIVVDWRRALLAVPVALLLALVAGLAPALRAARAHPAAALRPPVATARWVRRPRSLPGLALVNLVRTPGRTLLGAGALAIGVAALTVVAAAAYAFRGAIVGSLLGDTVSLSVRGADAMAAVATVLLGAAAVADVLYLNIRDRAAELATLRATGWTDAALRRLIGYEGLLLGALGALAGAGLGLGGAAWLVGELPSSLALVTAAVALAGMLVTCLAALVPAALLHRLPTARLLAEE
ncbi:FtsX-like permease family protein [Micromonospora sp. DR5-3]|uniref:FtsX-like permease family protein n=1 Tax=unclassified Micromonospora TaxID=2617518 RepID=UPI0011D452C5|nr:MULTISPECIES: FtsX-like permease family protein [unclassified Micromonospora]MCW3815074.1 FtsX-like permease family protein [Micromonospora sp. DR5-3]TYC25386.1 FtsX-like permease family protein [Micromonospora sp. MP36]